MFNISYSGDAQVKLDQEKDYQYTPQSPSRKLNQAKQQAGVQRVVRHGEETEGYKVDMQHQ